MRILDRFNRDELGNAIEVLVALLDIWDAPSNPDEPDFRNLAAEDLASRKDGMPGDPEDGERVGDEFDHSWPEWHARGRRRVTGAGYEMAPPTGWSASEDDEDDDPAGQYDEDEYTGTRPKGYGPGCKISDDDFEHDGQEPDHGWVCGIYGIDQTGPVDAPPAYW